MQNASDKATLQQIRQIHTELVKQNQNLQVRYKALLDRQIRERSGSSEYLVDQLFLRANWLHLQFRRLKRLIGPLVG